MPCLRVTQLTPAQSWDVGSGPPSPKVAFFPWQINPGGPEADWRMETGHSVQLGLCVWQGPTLFLLPCALPFLPAWSLLPSLHVQEFNWRSGSLRSPGLPLFILTGAVSGAKRPRGWLFTQCRSHALPPDVSFSLQIALQGGYDYALCLRYTSKAPGRLGSRP